MQPIPLKDISDTEFLNIIRKIIGLKPIPEEKENE